MKRVDLGVFTEIVAILDGSFEGGIFGLTAANGGITYAPFHDADIPDDVAAKLEETRKGLADGTHQDGPRPGHRPARRSSSTCPTRIEPPHPRPAPVLEVRGVTKAFPGVVANRDVDLTLHEGEVLCLLGENGAGKSTLMHTVFGLYQPDAGRDRSSAASRCD